MNFLAYRCIRGNYRSAAAKLCVLLLIIAKIFSPEKVQVPSPLCYLVNYFYNLTHTAGVILSQGRLGR